MTDITKNGFVELTETECNDVNGGFAITVGFITITGTTVFKFVAGAVITQGIKYVWKRTHPGL